MGPSCRKGSTAASARGRTARARRPAPQRARTGRLGRLPGLRSKGSPLSAIASSTASPRGVVLADLLPGDRVRDVVLVVGGALLTALFAQLAISVPGSPVPITGQT